MSLLSRLFNKESDDFIDCRKTCKMTKIMRNSKYCNGRARIDDGNIIYGCKENIENESKDLIQLYECNLIDMEIKDYEVSEVLTIPEGNLFRTFVLLKKSLDKKPIDDPIESDDYTY